MRFSTTFYIYTATAFIGWLAVIKFDQADPRKTPMKRFLIMLTLAYNFQAVSNFVFPTPNRDNNPFFIKIHLFTWFVHFLAMTIALFHLSRAKKGISPNRQRFTVITLMASLGGLFTFYFLNLFWNTHVPFRHLPGNMPELLFVESYYLAGAIFLFLTVQNLVDIVFHEKLMAQRARATFSGLAAVLGWLYYVIKAIFALAAMVLNLSSSNYPVFFQNIEGITLYLLISVVLSWAMVFLPSNVVVLLATPFEYVRKVLTLIFLRKTLHQISHPGISICQQSLCDLDLAIIQTVTKILDLRDVLISNEVTASNYQWLNSINDSSDIWEVIQSCVVLRHRFKSSKVNV